MKNKVALIIPTYNPPQSFENLLINIRKQKQLTLDILCIDSGSNNEYIEIMKKYSDQLVHINKKMFNHGGTRQRAIEVCSNAEFIIFLTQDVLIADMYVMQKLINVFRNAKIGCAYGRQLPHKNADLFGAHARTFNYPFDSCIKTMKDIDNLGIKTAFISNSFAAYRRSALMKIGGFPNKTILGEDTYVAAKMILNGWDIAYCAEASVYHSHNYSMVQEFQRYFDIGVFHARESWIIKKFGNLDGEGSRFIKSEFLYLIKNKKSYLLPILLGRIAFKYFGYRLGRKEAILPIGIKKVFSMYSGYWKRK